MRRQASGADARATVQLGGEQGGKAREVKAGDVIVIPAGVGHKKLGGGVNCDVVGAYPDGRRWDLLRGLPGERPGADRNVAAVPRPKADPHHGANGSLLQAWQSAA